MQPEKERDSGRHWLSLKPGPVLPRASDLIRPGLGFPHWLSGDQGGSDLARPL